LGLVSLHGESEKKLVAQVEGLAQRPDLRFFHWEIEFPEVFTGFFDPNQTKIMHKDRIKKGSAGFDVVIGNPPYNVLAEKELGLDLEKFLGYVNVLPVYKPACRGKQNLYKLFICRGVQELRQGGFIGLIVPMSLLGDDQAVGVRKMLLSETALQYIEAFPQKDDPKRRVFEDAKLSTCVVVTARSTDDVPFRARVHPGKEIEMSSPCLTIRRDDVKLYDPENQAIVACSQEDWDLGVRIMSSGRLGRLGDYCVAYQGEVNETTDRAKGNTSDIPGKGPQILRGSNVSLYALRAASQGETIYLLKEKYLKGKAPGSKAWHHVQRRAAFQRNSPQNNFRRLIACELPAGEFCCDTVSYFPETETKVPINLLVALFNSKLLDWYFRLGSTNSKVNDYQVRTLPIPHFESSKNHSDIQTRFLTKVDVRSFDEAKEAIEPLLSEPPFSQSVLECICGVSDRISKIELSRDGLARADRSSLDPIAQPMQDLLDHIMFRLAGLTDAEAEGLEQRLAKML
jgi:Eco57I restriction-modification methylase